MTEASPSENSYVFEAESASEVARLIERNVFFKKAMGGGFPEQVDLDGIVRILDIGCGPGGWAIDVAKSYPGTEVVGIDISETMLSSAKSEAQKYMLENIMFLRMNALQPLEFPDLHFDLVNMRAAVEYIPRANWNALLQECYRITRPGGILRLTEADRIAHTNSRAFERFHYFYSRMLYLKGYGFSPNGSTFGTSPMLGKLLLDAGYRHIGMKSYALDISYATMFQTDYRHLVEMRFEKVRSQLLERSLATSQELDDTYAALLVDITQKTFCGVAYPFIFWGKK
jgi:SAM-dependent methyltransferase